MLLIILDCLLGAVCGLLFRAIVLVPLMVLGCIEVAVISGSGTWSSAAWSAIWLICALEFGYAAGCFAALWAPDDQKGLLRDFVRRSQSGLSHHR